MPDSLPKYDSPPVVETVLGVQHKPLEGFTTAHVGLFWSSLDNQRWRSAVEVPRLEDQYESPGPKFRPQVPELKLRQTVEPNRIQLVRDDDERVIQIQDTRFIYNWRRRSGSYPSYGVLLPDFQESLRAYQDFLSGAGLGRLHPNQWEVTYVNHIPTGELWTTPHEWPLALLVDAAARVDSVQLESFGGQWQFAIDRDRGRLHVRVKHGKTKDPEQEILIIEMTARGAADSLNSLYEGLDLGHEVIVRTFTEITSEAAHRHWERRQ